MGQLTHTRIFNALVGLFVKTDSTDEDLVRKAIWRKTFTVDVTDGGTAATAQGEKFVWANNTGGTVKVTLAQAVAGVAVTGHATNYASFLLYKRTAAGGSQTTIGTYATDTATTKDMVANVPKDMTLTDAAVLVPDGYILTGEVTKASSGVAIGASTKQGRIVVTVEPVGT